MINKQKANERIIHWLYQQEGKFLRLRPPAVVLVPLLTIKLSNL